MKLGLDIIGDEIVHKFLRGEDLSDDEDDYCNRKLLFLNLSFNKKDSDLFEMDDYEESEKGEFNKDDQEFLKTYVENKMWVSEKKSHEFDDLDILSQDEEVQKREREKYEEARKQEREKYEEVLKQEREKCKEV